MPKISVIIPVYNTEKYLKECLDSIINQTLKDIEIICVDDGSTDGSLVILQEYAEKDKRIKILKGKGTGAGGARNVGLDVAQGEYLLFLDSDDFFELNMFEKMYRKGIETASDIVLCNACRFNTNDGTFNDYETSFIPDEIKQYNTFNREDIPNKIFTYFSNSIWNKLYKRSFVNFYNIRIQEIKRSNDLYFVRCALAVAKTISYVDEKFVFYRVGVTNNIQSKNINTPKEYLKAIYAIQDFLIKNNLFDKLSFAFKRLVIEHSEYYLITFKSYPITYFKLLLFLKNNVFKEFGIDIKEVRCWTYLQIFLAWLFSLRKFRYTNYKILNILGIRIKIKRKNKRKCS